MPWRNGIGIEEDQLYVGFEDTVRAQLRVTSVRYGNQKQERDDRVRRCSMLPV